MKSLQLLKSHHPIFCHLPLANASVFLGWKHASFFFLKDFQNHGLLQLSMTTQNKQNHSLLSVIQRIKNFLIWMTSVCYTLNEVNIYRFLYWQHSKGPRCLWEMGSSKLNLQESTEASKDVLENRMLKSLSHTGFPMKRALSMQFLFFVAGGFMRLRVQCPYCGVTTFCMINWLQITAQDAKITGRK